MVELLPLSDIEPQAVETLLDAAFGPDRFGRTAYRIREGVAILGRVLNDALNGSHAPTP